MNQRLALMGTTLALSVPLGLAAAAPVASAATYPSALRQEFTKTCTKSAKKQGVTSKQARTYCKAALRCLQRELTVRQFERYGTAIGKGDKTPPYDRTVTRCIKEAGRSL